MRAIRVPIPIIRTYSVIIIILTLIITTIIIITGDTGTAGTVGAGAATGNITTDQRTFALPLRSQMGMRYPGITSVSFL